MNKQDLGNQLRTRQIQAAHVPEAVINRLTDDEIIGAYTTCSCCGEKLAEGSDLDYAINTAANVDQFFEIVAKFAQIKHAVNRGPRRRRRPT